MAIDLDLALAPLEEEEEDDWQPPSFDATAAPTQDEIFSLNKAIRLCHNELFDSTDSKERTRLERRLEKLDTIVEARTGQFMTEMNAASRQAMVLQLQKEALKEMQEEIRVRQEEVIVVTQMGKRKRLAQTLECLDDQLELKALQYKQQTDSMGWVSKDELRHLQTKLENRQKAFISATDPGTRPMILATVQHTEAILELKYAQYMSQPKPLELPSQTELEVREEEVSRRRKLMLTIQVWAPERPLSLCLSPSLTRLSCLPSTTSWEATTTRSIKRPWSRGWKSSKKRLKA